MRCEDAQALLVALHDGELVGSQAERTRAHLAGCAVCRAERRALERTDALLEDYVVPAGPDTDFVARLCERIRFEGAVEAAAPRARVIRGPWRRGWAIAAAAVLLVAIGIGVVRQSTQHEDRQEREAVARQAKAVPTKLPRPAWQTPTEWPSVARTETAPKHAPMPATTGTGFAAGTRLDAETEAAIVRELDVLENLEVVEGMDLLEAIDLLDDPALDLTETG